MRVQSSYSSAVVTYSATHNVAHWDLACGTDGTEKNLVPNKDTELTIYLGRQIVDHFLRPRHALVFSIDFARSREHILRELGLEFGKDVFFTNVFPTKGLFVRDSEFSWLFPRVPSCVHELGLYQAMIEDSVLLLLDYSGPNDLMLPAELNNHEVPGMAVADYLLDYCSMLIAAGDDGYGIQVWMREGSSV